MKSTRVKQGLRAFSAFFVIITAVCLSSCSKKTEDAVLLENDDLVPAAQGTHHWYSFTRDGFEEIQLPRLAQKPTGKPWTEAARISSSVATESLAFFTANRRGILMVDGNGSLTLKTDVRFFPEQTVGSLFLDEGNPVFHVYRNAVFNTNDDAHEVAMPFIAEYNLDMDIFYPVLYRDDFNMTETQEVSSITVRNEQLYLSIKDMGKKTTFDYYRVVIPSTFTDTASVAHSRTIDSTLIEQSEFQATANPEQFSASPARLKELLTAIPSSVKYSITYQTTGNESTPKTYLHGFTADAVDSIITDAYAMSGSSWIAALFPDGTVYFQGALPDMYMVAKGKPVCFSMPDLPKGYIWTVFAITGNIMTAGWEESGLYKTGAAGFITVDLSKVLY
ncbi:MAG: hypothetical protein KBT02_01195 [Treponema sp.]|nr:hypothetical protein [Candidatus Treponema caballi]